MRALFISPHLDDAAFSAGALIGAMASAGHDVHVATLLTEGRHPAGGFALACQLDKGLDACVDYMAMRREEDEAAMAVLGADHSHHPFLEAPNRGYGSAQDLFDPPDENDTLPLVIAKELEELSRGRDVVFAPYALGSHVDHVLVRRAVEAAVGPRPLLLWRDLPYAIRSNGGPQWRWMGRERDLEPKLRACAAYGSQVEFQFGSTAEMKQVLRADFRASTGEGYLPTSPLAEEALTEIRAEFETSV